MSIAVTFTVRGNNPNTVWNQLAARLGREPTNTEARAEVLRVFNEARVDRAEAGRLLHQRR